MAGRFRGFLERFLSSRKRETAMELASDAELLRRFAVAGDQEAFELLIWRHGTMVLGVCQRQLRDEHLAEDAFQAVFLVLARKAHSIRGSNVAGWLFKVTRLVAARAVRFRLQSQELPEIPVEEKESRIEREELFRLLDNEVGRLPARFKQPVLLCYLGGRSTEEAARELNCPRGTILSRLSTARKLLILRLGRKGVTLPAALPVIGIELSGRIVSATVTVAMQFVVGRSPINTGTLLAEGVIRTMKHSKLLTVFCTVVLGVGLIGGFTWASVHRNLSNQTDEFTTAQRELKQEQQPAKTQNGISKEASGGLIRSQQPAPEVKDQDEELLLKLDPFIVNAIKPDPNDNPLRKLQKERCRERALALGCFKIKQEIGRWDLQELKESLKVSVPLTENLLELVEKPGDKIRCLEMRIDFLKVVEKMVEANVIVGGGQFSQDLHTIKAARIDAEIDLLKFKAQMEKAKK